MFKANLIANQNIVSFFSVVRSNHALHQLAALPALPLLSLVFMHLAGQIILFCQIANDFTP